MRQKSDQFLQVLLSRTLRGNPSSVGNFSRIFTARNHTVKIVINGLSLSLPPFHIGGGSRKSATRCSQPPFGILNFYSRRINATCRIYLRTKCESRRRKYRIFSRRVYQNATRAYVDMWKFARERPTCVFSLHASTECTRELRACG